MSIFSTHAAVGIRATVFPFSLFSSPKSFSKKFLNNFSTYPNDEVKNIFFIKSLFFLYFYFYFLIIILLSHLSNSSNTFFNSFHNFFNFFQFIFIRKAKSYRSVQFRLTKSHRRKNFAISFF